jgi:hypothetical protein
MPAVWSGQKTYASGPKKPSFPVLKFSMDYHTQLILGAVFLTGYVCIYCRDQRHALTTSVGNHNNPFVIKIVLFYTSFSFQLGPRRVIARPAHGKGVRGPRAARGEPPHVEGRLEKHALVHQEARGLRLVCQVGRHSGHSTKLTLLFS